MYNVRFRGLERVVLYVLGGSFVLSFLIGVLSKNPAGIVTIRAFLCALLVGALFQGGVIVLKKYIPDIDTMVVAKREHLEQETGEEDAGRMVDYTTGAVPSDGDLAGGFEGAGETGSGDSLDEARFPGEVTFQKGASTAPLKDDRAAAGASSEGAEEIEEALPSLESLFTGEEEEKTSPERAVLEDRREERKFGGDYISIGDSRFPNEPEVMAKAIKRVMKQDQ